MKAKLDWEALQIDTAGVTAVLIFCMTFAATALSAMSGGGSSIITVPVFLSLGLSLPLAMSVQQLCCMSWVLPVSSVYLRGRKIDWGFLLSFSVIGLIGAFFGVRTLMMVDQHILSRIIGIIILALVAFTFIHRDFGLQKHNTSTAFSRGGSYFFALILGFYEAIFGAGNGIFFSILAVKLRGFDFKNALGYYYAVCFPWIVLATILLIAQGYFSLAITIPAVAGSVLGGYLGSKFAVYKGNRFIKMVFVVIGGVLGIKLVLGY